MNTAFKYSLIIAFAFSFAILGCKNKNNQALNQNLPSELAALNKQIQDDPKNADLLDARSKYYLNHDKWNEALADINKAMQMDASKSQYYCTLSDVYLMMKKPSRAQDILLKAMKTFPDDPVPVLKTSKFFLIIKDYKKCFEYVTKAHQMDKNNPEAFFIQGFAFMETGDTVKAVENYKSAVELNQNYFEAFMQLGDMYAIKKDKLAGGYYDNALRINPKSIEALYGKALFCQENGMYDKATDDYNRILAIDPNYKVAYYNLGYLNMVYLKKYNEAVGFFEKAITLDPKYYEAIYNRGLSYELMGNAVKARADYQKVLEIQVNYPKAIEALNRLDKAGV
jgi:tetratricopeptide (TPR) repeat protein